MERRKVRPVRTRPVFLDPEVVTLRSANSALGLLTKLAGLAAGLTILGVVTGWQQATSYFSTLGAPWAAWLLSPADLIKLGAYFIVPFALGAIWSVLGLMDMTVSIKALRNIALGLFLIGLITLLIPETWIGLKFKCDLRMIGASALALGAGAAIGGIVGGLAKSGLQWSADDLWVLYASVAISIWQAPEIQGSAAASLDSSPQHSKLSFVTLSTEDGSDPWRLVSGGEKGFLIVRLAPARNDRIFRWVSASELVSIRPPSK